jgi:hypothetical protein
MNDDALAAVVAAAQLLLAGTDIEASAPAAACWTIAGRVRTLDDEGTRRVARFRSRWAMMGRLQ